MELAAEPEEGAAITAPASGYTCPDCHGALWEVTDGEVVRYRCRVGHSYASDSLLAAQDANLEEALWAAVRALEENASLAQRLRERAAARGLESVAMRYKTKYDDALDRANTLRSVLERRLTALETDTEGGDGEQQPG